MSQSRLQSANSTSANLKKNPSLSELSTANTSICEPQSSRNFRIRSASSNNPNNQSACDTRISKKFQTMKAMPSKRRVASRSMTNLDSAQNSRRESNFEQIPNFQAIEEAPMELENQATPAHDYEKYLSQFSQVSKASGFGKKVKVETDGQAQLQVENLKSGLVVIAPGKNQDKSAEKKYLYKPNLRDEVSIIDGMSRCMNLSEIPDSPEQSDDLDFEDDSEDEIASQMHKLVSTKTISPRFRRLLTKFGETDGFSVQKCDNDPKICSAKLCTAKVSKPTDFIKAVEAKTHWEFYNAKNAQRAEKILEVSETVKDYSTNQITPLATPVASQELEQLDSTSTIWHTNSWNHGAKFLPLKVSKPNYNLRGEVKSVLPKLKKLSNLQNDEKNGENDEKSKKLEALIEETKKIAINGPESVKTSQRGHKSFLQPDFTVLFDRANKFGNLRNLEPQMLVSPQTQMIGNKFAQENRAVKTGKSVKPKPVRVNKNIFKKETIIREMFDEAMLSESYTSNLAYKTGHNGVRSSSMKKLEKVVVTTKSSKVIRTQKSHSNLRASTKQPNIFDKLAAKPLASGYRVNLQANDREGRKVLKFYGDLQNSNLKRAEIFHMVKGADRRDVEQITNNVGNQYLDEMLNKIAEN